MAMSAMLSPSASPSGKRWSPKHQSDKTVEDLLTTFSQRFEQSPPKGKGKETSKSLCEQLEMLSLQKEPGHTVKDFLTTVMRKEGSASLPELMGTLSYQKAILRNEQERGFRRHEEQVRLLRSASAPALPVHPKPTVVSSTMPGSAAFSFGVPRHCKGKMKVPVLESRDPEYCHIPGGVPVPGVGQYNLSATVFPEALEMAGGPTGGWNYADHQVFMKEFEKSNRVASQGLFEHLYQGLPHISRLQITDHIRWAGEWELYQAKRQRKMDRYREERQATAGANATQKLPSKEDKEATREALQDEARKAKEKRMQRIDEN
ncbi:unnamed protein product, partial [Polarella glacialis]